MGKIPADRLNTSGLRRGNPHRVKPGERKDWKHINDISAAANRPAPKLRKDGTPRKIMEERILVHDLMGQQNGGLRCYLCLDWLSPDSFPRSRNLKSGLSSTCRSCIRIRRIESLGKISIKNSRLYNKKREELLAQRLLGSRAKPETMMLSWAKRRGQLLGLPVTISEADIVVPEKCPAFGFPLQRNLGVRGKGKDESPSLDRIIPRFGYIPGNVQVISRKANLWKNARGLDEWEQFAKWILTVCNDARNRGFIQ